MTVQEIFKKKKKKLLTLALSSGLDLRVLSSSPAWSLLKKQTKCNSLLIFIATVSSNCHMPPMPSRSSFQQVPGHIKDNTQNPSCGLHCPPCPKLQVHLLLVSSWLCAAAERALLTHSPLAHLQRRLTSLGAGQVPPYPPTWPGVPATPR